MLIARTPVSDTKPERSLAAQKDRFGLRRHRAWRTSTLVSSLTAMGLGLLPAGASGQTPATFSYTGSAQSYVVPTGVHQVLVTGRGGDGANGACAGSSRGGRGLIKAALIPAVPGETLSFRVGGRGAGSTGGFNGGGAGGSAGTGTSGESGCAGGGGGGATDIRRAGTPIFVAAGGGGGCQEIAGGAPDQDGYSYQYAGAEAGQHGTTTAGGAGGSGVYGGGAGGSGSYGAGGSGGTGGSISYFGGDGGGGGGGGYYGGGGGGGGGSSYPTSCAGGGGGASFVTSEGIALASLYDHFGLQMKSLTGRSTGT